MRPISAPVPMKRTFIVGDIHGCFDELMTLTTQIGLQETDLLISLGDIVDRGNKSKEVYEYFRNRPNSLVLMGNHERKHLNGVLSYAQEIVKVQFGESYPAFLDWLGTLDYYHETADAIIVHAAFEHDITLAGQKEEVLSGSTAGEKHLEKKYGTDVYWNEHYTGTKPVIYGHHVTGDMPKIHNNTYGIDTGCCHSGFLTALELPGFILHQVKAQKDYWKEEQGLWQIPVLKAKDWDNMEINAIRKQLDKLHYIEDKEVRQFLDGITLWLQQLEALSVTIKAGLDVFTQELLREHPGDFNTAANKLPFRTFLFKSKAGNLTLADVQKSLDTPYKMLTLAAAIGITDVPVKW